jgi:hypothetical protein
MGGSNIAKSKLQYDAGQGELVCTCACTRVDLTWLTCAPMRACAYVCVCVCMPGYMSVWYVRMFVCLYVCVCGRSNMIWIDPSWIVER